MVREFTDACRKYGLRIGLYYSPAQFGSKQKSQTDYDDYFIGQIKELLTGYGQIDYLWFDGCGCEGHRFDTARIVREIRACQPEILLFNLWDPDTRWVGNEAGLANSPNPLTVLVDPDGKKQPRFLPAECDCRMREESWFFSDRDADTVKSLDELMGLYYYSVGRGANLLLNIGPDRRGKLPARDEEALLRFGDTVRKSFSVSLPCKSAKRKKKLTLSFETQLVNHVVLTEAIKGDNEIESFEIRACPFPYGDPITVYRGTTIGHKAICPFPTIRTNKLEIVFDKEKAVEAKLFYLPRFG